MGDNSLIDPYMGFDLYEPATNDDNNKTQPRLYRHSIYVVYFTFYVWVVA